MDIDSFVKMTRPPYFSGTIRMIQLPIFGERRFYIGWRHKPKGYCSKMKFPQFSGHLEKPRL